MVDAPPGDPAISASAIRAADEVLLPLPPSTIDIDRLRPTLELLVEVDPLRAEPVSPRVLLARVRTNTLNARAARQVLHSLGLDVITAEIPLREAYAGAFGSQVTDLGDYAAVVDELPVSQRSQA